MKIRVYTWRKTFSICVPRAKPVKVLYRYAQMNIVIESNFEMFNRRIHVPKYTVSNIISNSLIIKGLYCKNVFC